jgi:hypothetical protein
MSRRRWLRLAFVAGVAAVAAGAWVAWLSGPSRFTVQWAAKGMTRAEVINAVGGPPLDYTDDRRPLPFGRADYPQWTVHGRQLTVHFGPDGRADQVTVRPYYPKDSETLVDELLDWLGL